jgi:site-specific recombinase XerD
VNTKRAYNRAWNAFTAWCADSDRTPLPATAETLAEYVTHVTADKGLAPATVEKAIACIRRVHREAGYDGQPVTQRALDV